MIPQRSKFINDMLHYLAQYAHIDLCNAMKKEHATVTLEEANQHERQRKANATRSQHHFREVTNLKEEVANLRTKLIHTEVERKLLERQLQEIEKNRLTQQRMMHLIERYTMDDPEWHPTERDARIYKSETTSYSSADSFPIE